MPASMRAGVDVKKLNNVLNKVKEDDNSSADDSGVCTSLLPRHGSFNWIRLANDKLGRSERVLFAQQVCQAVNQGSYWHGQKQIELKAADAAETSTTVISPSCGVWPSRPPLPLSTDGGTEVARAEGTVLSVAVPLARKGREVAVISAASAYQVGGGFAVGGRHALEESICAQSTLYRCLQHAWRQTGVSDGTAYIPHDGVVLSPRIEVFREGTLEGYATLAQPVELSSVVSVAMPNLNSRVRDAPLDKSDDPDAYRSSIACRWRAVLRAVCSTGATDLVCPDVGCGVYGNDPTTVGSVLGEVLRIQYWGLIKNLWLVGSEEFCTAVQAGIASAAKCQTEPLAVRENTNLVTLAALKCKLLAARIPGLSGISTRSGASTPTADQPQTVVREGNDKPLTLKNTWRPWTKKTAGSTTASTQDSSRGWADASQGWNESGNAPIDDAESMRPPVEARQRAVSKDNPPLTDELLRRHLVTLLVRDGTVPDEADSTIMQNTGSCVNPGRLLHPGTVTVSGYLDWDGVDDKLSQVVMNNINAEELRAEVGRLSMSSDSVVVSM